jgi:hypothetical protein
MRLNSTVSDDPVDELCQIRDELRVVWLALGNEIDEGYQSEVREHVNGIANRLRDIVNHMSGEALAKASRGGRANG